MAATRDTSPPLAASDTIQWMGDALDVGTFAVDRDLIVTSWNRWLELATGRLASDVVGRHFRDTGVRWRSTAEAAVLRATGGATIFLSHALHGYLFDVPPTAGFESMARMQQSVRMLPIPGPDGSPTGAVVLITDVTERVVRENELRASMEEAQFANRAKAEFLTSMSHELRTPIGAMSGYAELLADGIFGPVNETQQTQLRRIKTVGAHLLSIVEEILAYARIEAGRERIVIASVNALTLVEEAVSAVEPLARAKGLELHYALPTGPVLIDTDAVKVRQILINLLGNAVKFTDRGSITVGLDTAVPDRVELTITDTGPGIAPENQARIFEPFVQVDGKLTREHSGTGLGLAVSQVLARLLGGDLSITSAVGHGSTFRLSLPRS
jgi:signal transduction histidine kinase